MFESVESTIQGEALIQIPDDTIVNLLELPNESRLAEDEKAIGKEYVFIRYMEDIPGEGKVYEGFVHQDHVVEIDEADEFRQKRLLKEESSQLVEAVESESEYSSIEGREKGERNDCSRSERN